MSHMTTPSTPGAQSCADTPHSSVPEDGRDAPVTGGLFPPKDADESTRRAWLAATPWPEVVFASAG